MSLNLNEKLPVSSSAYCTSATFTEAVNDAQFTRTFGFVALICSLLIFIGGAIVLGIGMAVIGFGKTRYYRVLGITMIVIAVLSFLANPVSMVGPLVLSAGVAWKGFDILSTLSQEGKGDPDWQPTRRRAITSIVLSGIGLIISLIWLLLIMVGWLARFLANQPSN